ncbi:MAG TPA: hypothetical protein IAB24_04765 [Candidatus Copromonas avistercoris]|nr:hypothetical protein [Candidatus Copromonas avistercoris]
MPRTKGSKNKTALPVEERISAVVAEIEAMEEQLKQKKAALKQLKAEKEEENQKKILAAVAASGKSAEEVIALLEMSGNKEFPAE